MMIFAPPVVRIMCIMTICMSTVRSDLMMEMVQKQNIFIEKHTVITPDGYILALYHIPPKSKEINNETKVIFLTHGLTSLTTQYVLYPKDSAGYFFHHRHYDMWFGNMRGNTLSRNHTNLDPEGTEFWKFTFQEIGTIDMPTFIDYILNYTKKHKLILYGHSLGGSMVLVLLSELPEYNEKVSSIHLLAVSAITKSYINMLEFLAPNFYQIEETGGKDTGEVFSNKNYAKKMNSISQYCGTFLFRSACKDVVVFMFGPFSKNRYSKVSREPNYLSEIASLGWPAGTSERIIIHLMQCFAFGAFQKYDYGSRENIKLYGTELPPVYKLSNIRTNVHLIYGDLDIVAHESDARYLIDNMINVRQIRRDDREMNHIEFVFGPHVKKVNEIVDETIKQFGN